MEWDDLKKVDDVPYLTYRDTCYARGLLQVDKEYIDGLLEARLWGMGDYMRSMFVMLIMTYSMSRPEIVWEKTWHVMVEDVLNVERKKLDNPGIYLTVMDAVNNNKDGMFFVYGYGGTGKTYLYKTMSAALRCKGDIVLNVASSGIAVLLLEGGRTTHSRFAIPINVVEDSMTLQDIFKSDLSVAFDKVFDGKVAHCTVLRLTVNMSGENDDRSNVVFPDNMLIPVTDDDVGDERSYESLDYVCLADDDSNFYDSIYTTEFLNGLRTSGVPHHNINCWD
nr:NADH-ubiquinone oxidoreductase chain 2 [Tanacetum cinerariifolium]